VATTPAEALQLVHRALEENVSLGLILRLSRQIRRRASLKKLIDRWYLAAERHL
jgi:hypothetical protein